MSNQRYFVLFLLTTSGLRADDGLEIESLAKAPLKLEMIARIDAPPSVVFEKVAYEIGDWFEGIGDIAYREGEKPLSREEISSGDSRTCAFNDKSLKEDIVFWNPDSGYAYSVDFDESTFKMPIKNHMGVFLIAPDGQGGSRLVWRQYYDPKRRATGPLVKFMLKRMMSDGLDNLITELGGQRLRRAGSSKQKIS
ncbi:MAG: SRPBCC family protein [Verrucomicrobiota bacterium]